MTVRFSFIRVSTCFQINSAKEMNNFNFVRLEVMLQGFKGGARNRVRSFRDIDQARAYANKLLDGKWMSPEEYNIFYCSLNDIAPAFASARKAVACEPIISSVEKHSCFSDSLSTETAWEIIPYGFRLGE